MILPRGIEPSRGSLVLPGGAPRFSTVIALHEWWGLNEWVLEQTTNLAVHGYLVFAVDQYRGKVTIDRSEARKLKRNLPER